MKARIYDVTLIPVCRQSWTAWVQSSENYNDTTPLHAMNLSDENELIVNDIKDLGDNDIGIVDDAQIDRLTRTFTLNILLGNPTNSTPLQLNFPGTRSIADVKNDVYSVTSIAVRHQQWHGWPTGVTDDTAIALTGIPFEHNLVLHSTESTTTNQTKTITSTNAATASNPTPASAAAVASATAVATTVATSTITTQPNQLDIQSNARSNHNNDPIDIDSDSSVDEFEDASDFNGDDEMFAAPTTARRNNDLSECQSILEINK